MPTAPYNPIPQAESGTTLPQVHAAVPVEAFGSEIASAISTAGKTLAGVGDHIFERALFLQKENNQAEARTAEADYTTRVGMLHSEFNTLEGDAAVKAFPKYTKDLKALRESMKSTLTTQESQKLFDASSLGTLSRGVFNASSHMASQQKKYVNESFEAERESDRQTVAQNPTDDVGFERAVRKTDQSVVKQGTVNGHAPQATENARLAATSRLYASRIEAQAKENPLQGPTLFEASRSKLTTEDAKRVEATVNNERDAYGTSKIPQDYITAHTDEEGNLTVSVEEAQADMRKLAKQFSPDDPKFEQKMVRGFQSEMYLAKQAKTAQRQADTQTVWAAITGGATTKADVLANPQANAAFQRLPPSEQAKLDGQIFNYIRSRDRDFNERSMTSIMGLKNNDVESFLNLDPSDEKYKLSQAQIRQVTVEQAKIKKRTAQDPRVDRAMSWMRAGFGAQMEAMGVFRRSNSNKNDYDHLTGAVQSALDIWQEDHKKPPTNKEFNEQIAPNILKVHKEPGAFGIYGYGMFGNDRTLFKHDTSSREYKGFYEKAKADVVERGGSEPSDEEIYKAFTRLQLLKLYPPKGASKSGGGGE